MLNAFLAFAILFVVFVIWYAAYGRDWIATTERGKRFLLCIEPYEIALYKKSQTILWARFKMLTGVLLTVLTQAGEIDITPLLPLLSDRWRGVTQTAFNFIPLTLTVIGMVDEKQRNNTTQPVDVVALPEKVLATPEVAQAVATAEAAHVEVKAAVAVVKAEEAVTVAAEKKAEAATIAADKVAAAEGVAAELLDTEKTAAEKLRTE